MEIDNGMTVDKPKPLYTPDPPYVETCDICYRPPFGEIDNIHYCKQCYTETINDKFIKEE